MTALTPSVIARRIAEREWPDVQTSRKITDGVFEIDSAGHGGIIAVLDAMKANALSSEVIEVGRKHGLVVEYVIVQSRRRTRMFLSTDSTPEGWATWTARPDVQAATLAKGLAWIGEEDCAWSLLMVAAPAIKDAWVRSRRAITVNYDAWVVQFGGSYAREVAERWFPDVVADLDLTA